MDGTSTTEKVGGVGVHGFPLFQYISFNVLSLASLALASEVVGNAISSETRGTMPSSS